MPVSARKAPGRAKEELIKHHFVDPELQAEFDALTSNEDRLDYIEAFEGYRRLASRRTFSHDEVKTLLGIE